MLTTSRATYDAIASWYQGQLKDSWIHQTAIPKMLHLLQESGSIHGKQICDLGCGTGVFTRELARIGAQVTGIDISSQLLVYARYQEQVHPLGITYREADAQELFWPDEAFDCITSNLALIDIPDLSQLACTVSHLLRPGGIWIFSILHPCGPYSTIDGNLVHLNYYQEGYWQSENSASVRGRVGSYHRRISTYFQEFAAVGLTLEKLEEPAPVAPSPMSYVHFPNVLIMRWKKPMQNM